SATKYRQLKDESINVGYVHQGEKVQVTVSAVMEAFECQHPLHEYHMKINALRLTRVGGGSKSYDFPLGEDKDLEEVISEAKEKLDKLNKVLQQLPVKQREVFILRNFDEMSYEEISNITGKSVGGLKANYFHAYKKILELIKEGNDG
ncbi:MAG: sigma-70 family RNA polymerase sigma factor, partial [Bacteroidetes bacterium]|nr:sigma-70 family RNA polymerase sigma factor [Bacteroidota bacterium]